jgi:hypothetical protein
MDGASSVDPSHEGRSSRRTQNPSPTVIAVEMNSIVHTVTDDPSYMVCHFLLVCLYTYPCAFISRVTSLMGSSEVNSPAAGALKPLRGGCRTTKLPLGGLHFSCIVIDIYTGPSGLSS